MHVLQAYRNWLIAGSERRDGLDRLDLFDEHLDHGETVSDPGSVPDDNSPKSEVRVSRRTRSGRQR